ncbi:Ig-like domain-containing protein [Streptomyces sp. NPDC028635]|uniref:Ig-like domain-containing protein n=1 Tax=Streptomyces sp. NPDC028635 TaxID=3154800 RepID=UPI00340C302E
MDHWGVFYIVRKRSLSAATALAVLCSSAALVAGTAGSAAADSSLLLPLKSAGDVVVDGVHQRIFISDPSAGKVVATNYAGAVLATADALPGVTGLALSDDASRLYAAVPGADAVVALDTRAVTEQARYATGAGTHPRFLALAGGKIWFGYGSDLANGAWGDDDGDIGSLDVSGAEPAVALGQDTETAYSGAPRLVASPANPNVIAAAGSYSGTFALATYDVTTGSAVRTARAEGSADAARGMTNDLAYTPDGTRLITANPGGSHSVWQASDRDLTQVAGYPSEYNGAAVAVAPDGTVAVGSDAVYGDDVFVYRPGEQTAVRHYDFPGTGYIGNGGGDELVDGGLAWEPGGSRLFAVTRNDRGGLRLQRMDEPVKSAPAVTVQAPGTAPLDKALTVSGTVTASLQLPAGTPLTVTRYDAEAPNGKALGTRPLGANGAYSFTDTPTAAGTVTYKVAYAGDAEHATAAGIARVKVAYKPTAISLDRNGTVVNYGTTVTYTATLGATYKNRVVEIWADPWGYEPKRLLKRGTVNAQGKLSASMWMNRDTTVTAVFAGDARNGAASARSGVYTRAGVTTTLSRHYKWTKIGTTWYQTYHQSTDALITTWHNAYPGRYTRIDFQVYVQGAWQTGFSEFYELGSDGKMYLTLDNDGAAGYRARVRSVYVDGYNGDNVNAGVTGPWKYLNVTR